MLLESDLGVKDRVDQEKEKGKDIKKKKSYHRFQSNEYQFLFETYLTSFIMIVIGLPLLLFSLQKNLHDETFTSDRP